MQNRPQSRGGALASCRLEREKQLGSRQAGLECGYRSELVTLLEFCRAAKQLGFADAILEEMDLSDEGFEEVLGALERLVS